MQSGWEQIALVHAVTSTSDTSALRRFCPLNPDLRSVILTALLDTVVYELDEGIPLPVQLDAAELDDGFRGSEEGSGRVSRAPRESVWCPQGPP